MSKKLLPIIFILSFVFAQSIIHNPINNIQIGESLEIEASIIGLSNNNEDMIVSVFYRSFGQKTYFNSKMKFINGKYKYTIPRSFVNNNAIEYFIILEIENAGVYAYPEYDPQENPILVKSNNYKTKNSSSDISSTGLLKPNYQILSPEIGSNMLFEDLMISLSYFKMEDIDPTFTKIYINNIDFTDIATIRYSHFVLIPQKELPVGEHVITVNFRSISGLEYEPVSWKFNLVTDAIIEKRKIVLSQGGSTYGNYSSSLIEDTEIEFGEFIGDYHIDFDWMKIKINFLRSSLEDSNEQTKNRLTTNIKTSYFNINFGDSYPSFSEYSINGSRLRGSSILFNNNFLNFHFLYGSLLRSTQGLPDYDSMILSHSLSPSYNSNGSPDENNIGELELSRDDYQFKQNLLGLNIELKSKKFSWGLELLKVKDNIESVVQVVDNSILLLPEEMVNHLFSDICVDYNEDGYCAEDGSEFIESNCSGNNHDVSGTTGWDNINNLSDLNTSYFSSYSPSIINLGTFNEDDSDCNEDGIINGGEMLQKQWSIYIQYENLDNIIEDFFGYEISLHTEDDSINENWDDCQYYNCFGDYDVTLTEEQWIGNKPKDNIVIVTDFLHTLDDGFLKINYGLGFTMLNENIWDPQLTYENLDKLGETEEGYVDENENNVWDFTLDINEDGICVPQDGDECEEFTDSNGNGIWDDDEDGMFNGAPIPDIVNTLEYYEDIFQTGISQVPIVPIDITDGISTEDFLTLPSVAAYFDVSHKYFGHRINWGFKQVGPKYNTLGNPYIQTDIREQYFSDRTYFLDNKLNFLFKWKRTEDGISLSEENGQTDKFDINLGFFPGAGLPTYNLGVGIYNRTNGIDPLYEPILIYDEESDLDGDGEIDIECVIIDDQTSDQFGECVYEEYESLSIQLYQPEETRTGQFSLSVNSSFDYVFKHNFSLNIYYSNKRDLINLDKYILLNNDYYSPRSLTQSYNFGFRTVFTKRFESSLVLNYTYYNYGNKVPYQTYHPEYFQYQNIFTSDIGFFYDTKSWIGRINPGINLSMGEGSNNDFTQFSIKFGTQIKIIKNLNFNLNMNSKFKISNDEFYNDYSMYLTLKYKF